MKGKNNKQDVATLQVNTQQHIYTNIYKFLFSYLGCAKHTGLQRQHRDRQEGRGERDSGLISQVSKAWKF